MLNRGRNRILQAIITAAGAGPIGLELFMAIQMMRWAVFLLIPAGVLKNNMTGTMALMVTFAPAWVWSSVLVALVAVRLMSIVCRHRHMRQLVALASVSWWLVVTLLDATVGLSAGTINVATFAIGEVFAYVLLILAYDGEKQL
jgi:hypothetical protein